MAEKKVKLFEAICLLSAISLSLALSACSRSEQSSEEAQGSPITMKSKVFDDAKGVQKITVSRQDGSRTITWNMGYRCSGKVGQMGTFAEPVLEPSRNGFRTVEERGVRYLSKTVDLALGEDEATKTPNFEGWHFGLQVDCDEAVQ
jgi:hypothetical protein